MTELEPGGVEKGPLEAIPLVEEAVGRGVAVARVPENGVTDGCEVASNLVRAPLLGSDLEKRVVPE